MTSRRTTAILLVLVSVVLVQPLDGQEAGNKLPPGWKDLDLSSKQKTQVNEIRKQFDAKRATIKERRSKRLPKAEQDALRKQERELDLEEKSKLAGVLTREQTKKLAKILLEM